MIAGLVVQDPYRMGYDGVKTALAASKGESVPANRRHRREPHHQGQHEPARRSRSCSIRRSNSTQSSPAAARPIDDAETAARRPVGSRAARAVESATVTRRRRPSAGAPMRARKLDKRFGATHALKAVDLDFRARRDPRHRRRKRRRQIDADQAPDRRLSALIRRDLLARARRWRSPRRTRRSRSASTRCIRKSCCARI